MRSLPVPGRRGAVLLVPRGRVLLVSVHAPRVLSPARPVCGRRDLLWAGNRSTLPGTPPGPGGTPATTGPDPTHASDVTRPKPARTYPPADVSRGGRGRSAPGGRSGPRAPGQGVTGRRSGPGLGAEVNGRGSRRGGRARAGREPGVRPGGTGTGCRACWAEGTRLTRPPRANSCQSGHIRRSGVAVITRR